MLDDALVVVTADHGEEFFEHGRKGHQQTLFDEVVRIPLVLHWPGRLPAGRVVRDQVRVIDLAPTLLAAAGVSAPPAMQGRDLLPLAEGGALPPRAALLELHADGRDQRALRTLTLKAYAFGRLRGRRVPERVYDLAQDPRERAARRRGSDPRFEAAFEELEATRARASALRAELGGGPAAAGVDGELRERLRELGYVDGPERE